MYMHVVYRVKQAEYVICILVTAPQECMHTLHVEYAERSNKHGIPFIFSLFGEYSNLEYVSIYVIYKV